MGEGAEGDGKFRRSCVLKDPDLEGTERGLGDLGGPGTRCMAFGENRILESFLKNQVKSVAFVRSPGI